MIVSEFIAKDQTAADESNSQNETGIPPVLSTALDAIGSAVDRLNQVGIMIRQSSESRKTSSAPPGDSDSAPFKDFMLSCVRALYPGSRAKLQEYLTEYLIERHDDAIARQFRQQKLEKRRERENTSPNLGSRDIRKPETPRPSFPPSQYGNLETPRDPHPAPGRSKHVRQSEHSSIISARLREHQARPTWLHGSQRGGASSVQVQNVGYPEAPRPREGSDFIKCEWCSQLLKKSDCAGAKWKYVLPFSFLVGMRPDSHRLHVDMDFKPYVCLSEECSCPDRGFTSFKNWYEHMKLRHGEYWYLETYPALGWACVVCDTGSNLFNTAQGLNGHLRTHNFTDVERETIVCQSRTDMGRGLHECLLCCRLVENDTPTPASGAADSMKQDKTSEPSSSPSKQPLLGHGGQDLSLEDPDTETLQSPSAGTASMTDHPTGLSPEIMSRHIANHLQMLMNTMIRLMRAQDHENNENKDDGQQDCASTVASGNVSSQRLRDEKDLPEPTHTPLDFDTELMVLDNEALDERALDRLNNSVDGNVDLVDAVAYWRDHLLVEGESEDNREPRHPVILVRTPTLPTNTQGAQILGFPSIVPPSKAQSKASATSSSSGSLAGHPTRNLQDDLGALTSKPGDTLVGGDRHGTSSERLEEDEYDDSKVRWEMEERKELPLLWRLSARNPKDDEGTSVTSSSAVAGDNSTRQMSSHCQNSEDDTADNDGSDQGSINHDNKGKEVESDDQSGEVPTIKYDADWSRVNPG